MPLLSRSSLLLVGVASLLLMAFGLFRLAIELGVSPARYVVQDLALALLGGLGLWWSRRQSRRLQQAREREAVAAARSASRFEANARTWVQGLVVLVLLAIAAGSGVAAYRNGDPGLVLLAVGLLLVAWLVAALAASHHRGGQPTLVMDVHGLDHAWYGKVRWSDVQGIALRTLEVKHNKIHSLVLGVESAERYLAARPWIVRIMQTARPKPVRGYVELEIPLNPLSALPVAIEAAARELRSRTYPPPVDPWFPGTHVDDMKLRRELQALDADMAQLPPEEALRRMLALEPEMQQAQARGEAAVKRLRRTTWMVWGWIVACLVLTALLFWFKHG